MANIMNVPTNECTNMRQRITREGKRLTYCLSVVQQPERARACGQGAKSSSDRRPVDPPPIVELRVTEGDENRDITFAHNAGFFLFATLENVRSTASQSRMPTTQNNSPILTGTPVAGISYLDRPAPAGYFIFPDLSVRHEGRYRLVFHLYEDLKEQRDSTSTAQTHAGTAEGLGAHVHGRCEVRSKIFDVFSAKKFPGLAESTHLSRMVADQGCRVRIRREVRLRRRDSKHEKDWDPADGNAEADSPRSPTPETVRPLNQTPQQVQHGFDRPVMNYSQPVQSGPKQEGEPHGYTPYQLPYPGTQQNYPQQSSYDQRQMQQYPAQYMPPPSQPMGQFPQGAYGYQQQPNTSIPSYSYMMQQSQVQNQMLDQQQPPQFQQPQQPPPQYQHTRQDSGPYQPVAQPFSQTPEAHTYNAQQSQPGVPLGQMQDSRSSYGHPPSQSQPQPQHTMYPPTPSPSTQPPYSSHHSSSISSASSTSTLMPGRPLPPLTTSDHAPAKLEPASPAAAIAPGRPPPPLYMSGYPSNSGRPRKRSFGSVFGTQHAEGPLRDGARPAAAVADGASDPSDGSEDMEDMESITMTFRRADGSLMKIPPRRYGLLQ